MLFMLMWNVHCFTGHVQSRAVYYFMNIHVLPRTIYLARVWFVWLYDIWICNSRLLIMFEFYFIVQCLKIIKKLLFHSDNSAYSTYNRYSLLKTLWSYQFHILILKYIFTIIHTYLSKEFLYNLDLAKLFIFW